MNKAILSAATLALLAGCTSGNSRIEPGFTSVNPLAYKLEFAIGTANYQVVDTSGMAPAVITITGINTVETYRQPDGLSGTLVNSPSIFGPTGFVVPEAAGSAGDDAGTASITSTPQIVQPGSTTPPNTFGQAGGVFAYGFLPVNSTNSAVFGNNGYTPYGQPFYTDAFASDGATDLSTVYLGGPPAYTNVRTGTYPSGFIGFTQGFNSFGATIGTGAYTLSDVIPTSTTKTGTLTAAATLSSAALLPVYGAPTSDTEDTVGGASFTVTVPAGVDETLLDVVDLGPDSTSMVADCHTGFSGPYYYTVVDHTAGPATATITLPANAGPILNNTGAPEPTLCPGDDYAVYEVGTDYPAYEAGPGQSDPSSLSETPTLLGAAGVADITVSAPATTASGIYGVTATSAARKPQAMRLYLKARTQNTFHPKQHRGATRPHR